MNLSIYFVTPDGWLSRRAALEALVLAAARGGATMVQLRDKQASDAEMAEAARWLKARLAPLGVPLIVNDRVEVMRASGADGVHVGQTDAPAAETRRRIGSDRVLGLSIETEAQLAAMPAGIVDYIGIGPLRSTASKTDAATPLGIERLAGIVRASPVPAVAIGGVGLADIPALKACGTAGMAVILAIAAAAAPEAAARALAEGWAAR